MTNPNQNGTYNPAAPKQEPRDKADDIKSKKNPNDRDEEEIEADNSETEAE